MTTYLLSIVLLSLRWLCRQWVRSREQNGSLKFLFWKHFLGLWECTFPCWTRSVVFPPWWRNILKYEHCHETAWLMVTPLTPVHLSWPDRWELWLTTRWRMGCWLGALRSAFHFSSLPRTRTDNALAQAGECCLLLLRIVSGPDNTTGGALWSFSQDNCDLPNICSIICQIILSSCELDFHNNMYLEREFC